MGKFSKVDIRGMKTLYQKMARLEKQNYDAFCRLAVKELAARLLSKVIPRTPVGDYKGDEMRYKRDNKKKGIKAGDVMKTKNGETRYSKDKTVSFTTKDGKGVTFKAHINKVGGRLRRGWTSKTEEEAEAGSGNGTPAARYAETLRIQKKGASYEITIENPVHYAPYVEFGHRVMHTNSKTGEKKQVGFVKGKFMLKISEDELRAQAPAILEKKLTKFLQEVFSGDGK